MDLIISLGLILLILGFMLFCFLATGVVLTAIMAWAYDWSFKKFIDEVKEVFR